MRQYGTDDVEIQLEAADSTYKPGDTVKGHVVVTVSHHSAPFTHNGITLEATGSVQLRLGDSSVGIFEALFSSIQ